MNNFHTPVLVKQVTNILDPAPGQVYIDATLGNAGHTIKLLEMGATIFGIDLDSDNLHKATNRIKSLNLSKNFIPINDNFKNIKKIHQQFIKKPVDGILFDLGLSQNQQISKNRGFSFNDDQSFDMRINPHKQAISATDIINTYSQEQLFQIFSKYGQEKFSQQIAKLVTKKRKIPITTAKQFADMIKNFYLSKGVKTRLHPATKIFLALKIYINQELTNLKQALIDSLKLVKKDGNIAVITFHSTEDRLVKNFIKKSLVNKNIKNSTRLKPDFAELKSNPLSRSAILRTFQVV